MLKYINKLFEKIEETIVYYVDKHMFLTMILPSIGVLILLVVTSVIESRYGL